MSYRVSSGMTNDEAQFVRDELDALSEAIVGPRNTSDLRISLRDDDGSIVGGIVASITWNWLHIHALWISETAKGHGYGAQLLAATEHEARDRGCSFAKLQTLEFQAKSFYEKQGYVVVSRLDGYPKDYAQYLMSKTL